MARLVVVTEKNFRRAGTFRWSTPLGILLVFSVLGSLECQEHPQSSIPGLTVSRVGEDLRRLQGLPEDWRVDPNPVVTIGVLEGPEEYTLPNVYDATVLSDGTIVVSLAMRNFFELRYFDGEGVFITAAGRWGPGPFEVGSSGLSFVGRLPGDSILVVRRDHGFSVFGPRGEKARSGRYPFSGLYLRAHLVDENHLALEKWEAGERARDGSGVEWVVYLSYDLGTESLDTIAKLPGFRSWVYGDGEGFEGPFSPSSHVAAGNGRFWFGSAEEAQIHAYSSHGKTTHSVGIPRERGAVTGEDKSRYKEFDLRGSTGASLRGREAHHRRADFPDSFPAFQDLEVDDAGNLWVLAYEPRWSKDDYSWDVLDPAGTHRAIVTVPFGIVDECVRTLVFGGCLRSLEVGEDYLLIQDSDDLGIQRVKKYRIEKGIRD